MTILGLAGLRARVEVYVVRHADAMPATASGDKGRALSAAGVERAAQLGRELAAVTLDMVLASDAARAAQTVAAIIGAQVGNPAVTSDDRFYEAGAQAWFDALAALPATTSRVLLVGHNPALGTLVSDLLGEHVSMPAGACVALAGEAGWPGVAPGAMRRI